VRNFGGESKEDKDPRREAAARSNKRVISGLVAYTGCILGHGGKFLAKAGDLAMEKGTRSAVCISTVARQDV
jgi:hypothetical protein